MSTCTRNAAAAPATGQAEAGWRFAERWAKIENDRRVFLAAMAEIKQGMILGIDKDVYVEPAIWTIEWARDFYEYPVTRSN